ncbi:hypothetical protein KUCAC02_031430 [Chaenocephalus aceratus]|nr:hypothetical protein KUCAC02_031430 [Chaenocephalus aceratus]
MRSDLTAYRSYCVTALLIRHKLSKEAVVEFQVHDWLHRTTGSDGTTIRLTSSKAAGHTFTLSQQEDEVGLKPTKGLTSGQGRFFVDCGGNPLTNIYSDLQRLRKKPLYRKWRNVQLLERTSYILRCCAWKGRSSRRANIQSEPYPLYFRAELAWACCPGLWGEKGKGVVATCPMDKGDVVCDYHGTLISVAEGHRRGDSIYRFFFKELCIDASSRCDCHPEVETTTTPPPVVTATLKWRHMDAS